MPIVISKDNWKQVEIVKIIGDGDAINVATSRDQKIFAVGFHYAIRVFDMNTWEEITHISSLTELSNVAISPDGSSLVAGTYSSDDPAIVIWDINTGRELKVISSQGSDNRFVTYSPDGTIFAVSGFAGTYLYDPKDWSVVRKIMWAGGGSLEFSMG